MTFDEFKKIKALEFESDELKTDTEPKEFQLAMRYAIGREKENLTGDTLFTTEEIAGLILKYCGKEVYNRILQDLQKARGVAGIFFD